MKRYLIVNDTGCRTRTSQVETDTSTWEYKCQHLQRTQGVIRSIHPFRPEEQSICEAESVGRIDAVLKGEKEWVIVMDEFRVVSYVW
jgi:hypothetical protein